MKKNTYKPIQFIPKNINEQSNNHIKKNDTKLSYEEIRKIIENKNDKEIHDNSKKNNIKKKFDIV